MPKAWVTYTSVKAPLMLKGTVHTGFGATYVAIQATSKQLKLYIKQEWERIPPEKLQKLVSSVPKRLLSVVKRKGDVTQW